MDSFDEFDQTTRVTETTDEETTNIQNEDLFGSEFTDNTTVATSTNPFSNVQQQPDLSWALDDDVTDTTTNQTNLFDDNPLDDFAPVPQTTTNQTNLFDDNTLDDFAPIPQTTSFSDNLFTNESNTNEFDSYPSTNIPPTADELLYNDSDRRPSENNLSFQTYPNSISSSTNTYQLNSSELFSTENVSALQAFNTRRQQEIAEMEVIEKQKIEELRQQGKKELERWYEERRTRIEQKRQSTRHEEDKTVTQALEKSDKTACDWAKVIRFLEFSQGSQITKQKRDLNRMRAVIIQAKRDKDNRISTNGV